MWIYLYNMLIWYGCFSNHVLNNDIINECYVCMNILLIYYMKCERHCQHENIGNDDLKFCHVKFPLLWKCSLLCLCCIAGVPLESIQSATSIPLDCVSDCTGVADGDYHSCQGCIVYASCSNGMIFDGRPCPPGLVWDDYTKMCESTSTTCSFGMGVSVIIYLM